MPFKSERQRKYLNYLASEGKFPKEKIKEYNKASKGMKLPDKAKPKKKDK